MTAFSTAFLTGPVAVWLLSVWLVAATGPFVDLDAEINALVDSCGHRSGLAVALVSLNETLGHFTYAKGFGLKDIENNVGADENTFLCIGSVTKHFTATLLVHLLDLLNSTDHSPQFLWFYQIRQEPDAVIRIGCFKRSTFKDARYTLQTFITDLDPALLFPGSSLLGITLEDILSMRTGLTDYYGPGIMGYPLGFTPRDLAREVITKIPRFAGPRQKFFYSNHVFSLAGYACELLGAIYYKQNYTWEQLINIHLFDPIGIGQDANFVEAGSGYADRVAKGYVTEGGVYKPIPAVAVESTKPTSSAASICLSPKAMAVWMKFLLNKGVHEGKVIIRSEVIEETWKPRIHIEGSDLDYALGWRISTEHGSRVVQHTGGITMYQSNLVVYPEWKHALFVSSSGGYFRNVITLRDKLVDTLKRALGVPVKASTRTCTAIPVPVLADNSDPAVPVESKLYTGTYSHPIYGTVVLREEGENLRLEMGRLGKASVQCRRCGTCSLKFQEDLFWMSADGGVPMNDTILFGKSCSGRVINVTLPMYSPDNLIGSTRPAPVAERCPAAASSSGTVKVLLRNVLFFGLLLFLLWR